MKNHKTTNGIKIALFATFLLLASLNLSAQYKLEFEWMKEPAGGSSIAALAVTNSDSVIYLSVGTSIYKVRMSDGEIIKSYPIESAYPWFIMSKDEKTIIVATGNAGEKGMGLLESETYKRKFWLDFPNFTGVTYNEKSNKMVVNYQPIIRIYDIATQKLYKEINTDVAITQVNLTDDGKYIVYGYYTYTKNPDKTHYFVKIMDLDGKLVKDFGETSSSKFALTVDGKTIIYFMQDGIHFLDLESLKEKEVMTSDVLNPDAIEMSNDGKFMLVGTGPSHKDPFANILMKIDFETKKHYVINDNSSWIKFKLSKDNSSLFWGIGNHLYKFNLKPTTSVLVEQNNLEFVIQTMGNNLIISTQQEMNPNFQFRIASVNGQIHKTLAPNEIQYTSQSITINISSLLSGTYFIEISDNQKVVYSSKFTKIN